MRYIFSDMDGTLLHSDKTLPQQLFPLMEALKKRNIIFGIASGRQYYNLYEQFQQNGDDMIFIAENGAVMFEGKTCIYHNEIEYPALTEPVMRIRQLDQAWCVLCGVHCAYVENTNQELLTNSRMYYRRLKIVDDVLEAAKHDHICKIAVYDAVDSTANSMEQLKLHNIKLDMVVSGKHWLDLTNQGVNKGSALAYLKKLKQISSARLMAFGDYMNDYEMLQECKESYAMANAHPEILKIAAHHAKSNDEDGVIQAILQYFQITLEDE